MATGKKQKEILDETETEVPTNIGVLSSDRARKLAVADYLEGNMPTFNVGQPGFEKGQTLAGTYIGTKRVYSAKFNNPKVDEQGRKYRDLHQFKDDAGNPFGIWSVGKLALICSRLVKGMFVALTYNGLDEKPLKAGRAPAHDITPQTEGGLLADPTIADEMAQAGAVG